MKMIMKYPRDIMKIPMKYPRHKYKNSNEIPKADL